jgi:hypothetical protein
MLVHEVDGRTLTEAEHIAELEGRPVIKREIINGVVGRTDLEDRPRVYIDPADPDNIYPSVTAVLGATHSISEVLLPAARRIEAEFVVDNLAEVTRRIAADGAEETMRWIAREAERVWTVKRDIGTHQHNILEALLIDSPIPHCPEHLQDIEIDGEAVDQDEISEGLINFLCDYDPVIEMAEAEVCNPAEGWAGTLDLAGYFNSIRIPGRDYMGARLVVDLKTGKVKGDTARPQIVTYQNATEVWVDKLGNKVDMPPTDLAAVLHVRKHYRGGYKLFIVEPRWEAFHRQQFLTALALYRHQEEAQTKPMAVFYPPKGDGSQPLPRIEDIEGDGFGRCRKPLIGAGLEKLDDLLGLSADEVQSIHGVGPKSIGACRAVLARYELAFAGEES